MLEINLDSVQNSCQWQMENEWFAGVFNGMKK